MIYNFETKKQHIIPCTEGAQNVSALSLSPSKKYLAIAERTLDVGLIKVIDLRISSLIAENKPKKILFHSELNECHYVCMSFFLKDDHKYLAGITNNSQIVVFEWDKAKVKSCVQVSCLHQPNGLFFNPLEKDIMIVYGNSISNKIPFKMIQTKVENGNVFLNPRNELFKDFVKNYNYHILSHTVLKDSHYNLLFGTLEGELLLVNKQYELKLKLLCSPLKHFKIEQILALDNGFAIAGSSAKILFFEKNLRDLKNPYFQSENRIELHQYIYNSVNNFICLNSDTFLIGLSSGELIQASLLSNKNGVGSHYKIESCILQFHNKRINDIQICERKSILVTCSADYSVLVFNYLG